MKKTLKIGLIILGSMLGLGILGVGVLAYLMSTPLSRAELETFLNAEVQATRGQKRLENAGLLLVAPENDLRLERGGPRPDQTFHTASVGKLFTAVLIARKVEVGTIGWESSVADILGKELLQGLIDDVDLPRVTIADLLGHTSGMADYFDGPTVDGSPRVAEIMVKEPGRLFSPQDLLDHSRQHQKPGKRGDFHYSDTGFTVLGLVVEKLYGQSFTEAVQGEIFVPLGMDDSYYPGRSLPVNLPAKDLAASWLGSHDLAGQASLSADWAGGGVASTLKDLGIFATALARGDVLRPDTLAFMAKERHVFETGIHYGLGVMTLRFGEFMPLLDFLPSMIGHMGILGTQVFLEPASKTTMVVSLGADGQMEASVRLLISAMTGLARLKD